MSGRPEEHRGGRSLASALTLINLWRFLESPSQVPWGFSAIVIVSMETIEISDIK